MSLVEFCLANGISTVDKFALEIYRQSGEADKAWHNWLEAHSDSDRLWISFWKWQQRQVLKAAREYEKQRRKRKAVGK
jgi:hypothetical protein